MNRLGQFLLITTAWLAMLHPIQSLAQEDDDDSRDDEGYTPSPTPQRPRLPHCFANVVDMRYGLNQFGFSAILLVKVEGEPNTTRQVFVQLDGHAQSDIMMGSPISTMLSGIAPPSVTSLRIQGSGNLYVFGNNRQITDLNVTQVRCFPKF